MTTEEEIERINRKLQNIYARLVDLETIFYRR